MQYSRCGRMYVLYMRLKSFTSRRLKFLLTIAITRRAVAAAFMHCCDDLKFDDRIMPRSPLLVHSVEQLTGWWSSAAPGMLTSDVYRYYGLKAC